MISGDFGTRYHFTFASDEVRLIRDNLLPILFHPLSPGVPHPFRLELYNSCPEYAFYIDGEPIEDGVAEGPYPANQSGVISFRAKCVTEPSVARWDFVRLGRIPQDASGDYDSDGVADAFDYYFVHDCLTKDGPGLFGGPGEPGHSAGPGCRFCDMDQDSDTDLLDFAEFQNRFFEPGCRCCDSLCVDICCP